MKRLKSKLVVLFALSFALTSVAAADRCKWRRIDRGRNADRGLGVKQRSEPRSKWRFSGLKKPIARLRGAAGKKLDSLLPKARKLRSSWYRIAARNKRGAVNMIVEIPAGSREKYEMDVATGKMSLDRMLPAGFRYPAAYGLIPRTFYFDGDPIDALFLGAAKRGANVSGHVVGVLYMEDEKGRDSKLIVVPENSKIRRLSDIPKAERDAISSFFANYKKAEMSDGKFSKVSGWGAKKVAQKELSASIGFFDAALSRR